MKLNTLSEQIHRENPDNPSNPEVEVQGVGVYELDQVKRNVTNKINDMNDHVIKAKTAEDWERVQWMVSHGAMGAMIQAIVDAENEMEHRSGNRDEMRDVPTKAKGM